jgi:hypothetical protein
MIDIRTSICPISTVMHRKGKIFIYSLSALFTIFGLCSLSQNIQHIAEGVKLKGVVIAYEARDQSYKGRSGSTDAPILKFEYQNQSLEIASQMSSARHGYDIGDVVTIYFNPENTEEILLDSIYHKYGFGGLFLILGILLGTMPRILKQ